MYLSDPEGNGIEVYRDRPSQEWSLDGRGQVRMQTLRLDLDRLRADAGGEPFTGMADGTIVGHVHLRVGDVPAAEAFYGALPGLAVTTRYPGAAFFGAGGYHHHLAVNAWHSCGAGTRPDGVTGLAEVELRADAGLLADLPADATGGIVHDPWGTRLRFVEG